MTLPTQTLALIGTGMLGREIARGLLASGHPPERLILANTTGTPPEGLPCRTTTPAVAAEAADAILLCVPPAAAPRLGITTDKPVLSTMAGLTLTRLTALTGSPRVIRAMSSPAAGQRLAFSPWAAAPGATPADKALANALFSAIGTTAELSDEAQIDVFTAITGPVPGFVAFFAEAVQAYAESEGIAPDTALAATRQLFLSAGQMLAAGPAPAVHVQQMIDYAGTTAAGLDAMRASPLAALIAEGLAAATARARTIG
ncbi:pyrroline-5-carboxylate reductase family protein [Vannielia litorea]|uniref:pyrroline-5-carboxylate reductase family protein n=1 Tax=Vannielia litorea TaxID=1217970 RepID=UPI001BCA7216|nr:pyrroline-5-carboxylate reductase dimerization domain-containing protein [Vannielia litorea]MBS8225873.1 pyrroline-5-carboxylate reductase [Vannielia litorea]